MLIQTVKPIEINSPEWQKSDDHTWYQLVLTFLARLGLKFQRKEIDISSLVHASTGTGEALILQQERRDSESRQCVVQQKTCSQVFLLNRLAATRHLPHWMERYYSRGLFSVKCSSVTLMRAELLRIHLPKRDPYYSKWWGLTSYDKASFTN